MAVFDLRPAAGTAQTSTGPARRWPARGRGKRRPPRRRGDGAIVGWGGGGVWHGQNDNPCLDFRFLTRSNCRAHALDTRVDLLLSFRPSLPATRSLLPRGYNATFVVDRPGLSAVLCTVVLLGCSDSRPPSLRGPPRRRPLSRRPKPPPRAPTVSLGICSSSRQTEATDFESEGQGARRQGWRAAPRKSVRCW